MARAVSFVCVAGMRPVIVGGGPAGSAAAIVLAQAGAAPLVLERSTGPHDKVCGDFLSGEAGTMLERLGISLDRLGAMPVRWVRLVWGKRSVTSRLPFPAWSLSRRALDEALLQRAAACGTEVVRGETIRSVRPGGTVERAGGGVITSAATFLATGKHDVRGSTRPRDRRMVGFKTYVRLAPAQFEALAGGVEIVLLPGGYAGLQNVEDGRTVLCWLARGGDARVCLAHPHVTSRLKGASMTPDRLLSVAGMPYGFLAPPADFFRVGDQAAVIPSFAGAGVAIALISGAAAAQAYLGGEEPPVFQHSCQRLMRGPVWRAALLHQALSTGGLKGAAFAACALWPGVMAVAARATRVSHSAERNSATLAASA